MFVEKTGRPLAQCMHALASLTPCQPFCHAVLATCLPESLPLPLLPVLQEEVKSVTGSRFSREAFVVDLQSKVEAAAKEKADAELQTRLLSEELSDAGEENKRLEEVVKGLRELVQAAELSAGSLKQQVAEARSEADVQERRYAVRPAAAGGVGVVQGAGGRSSLVSLLLPGGASFAPVPALTNQVSIDRLQFCC